MNIVLQRFVAMFGSPKTLTSKYKTDDGDWVYVVAYMPKDDEQEFLETLELHGYQFTLRKVDGELEFRNV